MQTYLAHMAAGRHPVARRAFKTLARIILVLPLAAFWAALSFSLIAATAYGWYAAGTLLLHVI